MAGMVNAAQNPYSALTQLTQQDPRMQQVMQVVQQNGGDAKSAFYNLARQKGVDPDTVLQQIRSFMK